MQTKWFRRTGCAKLWTAGVILGPLLPTTLSAGTLHVWQDSLTPTAPDTSPAKVGENIRMGDDPAELPADRHAQAEPHIARSWTDPNLIVAMFQEGRYDTLGSVGHGYAVSTNGGLSWNRAPLLDTTVGFGGGPFESAADPVVAFDLQGRVFLNSLAFNTAISAAPSQILVHRSDNGGQTFDQPFSVYTDDWPNNFADKNWLAIDTWPASPHVGRIAVSFALFEYDAVQGRETATEILNTFSDDGGGSWSTPVSLGLTNTLGAQPLFLPDGSLAICYWRIDGGFGLPLSNHRIEVKISPDGGTTFGEPIRIVSNVALYDDPTTRDGVWLTSATADRLAGVMYLAYQARAALVPRILFTKSIDQGQTWTPPGAVSDTPGGKSVFNPAIAASPDGQHVTITFYDKRDGTNSNYVDLYLAESFDGGDTWGPNVRLSTVSSDLRLAPLTSRGPMLGDYQGITPALNFDAPAVAVWIDTRTGSPDPFGVRIKRVEGTTFETWRRLRYSAEELADLSISGQTADREGDGIVNVFEYVYATEPDVPSLDPLKIDRGASTEEGVIVSYERLAVIGDVGFTWLASENLSDWSEVEPVSEQIRIADNPIMERVEARFSGDLQHLFLRLGVRVLE